MVVQHNLTAMNSNRMLGVTTSAQAKSSEKLSSGYRINRAADDAAGLTISEKMRKQMRGLDRASTNAQDGVSAVQTAEGALTEVHSMLQRMNELANQASNGTNSTADRDAIQAEIDQLNTEIDRVSETTKFNETYLLKGDEGSKVGTLKAHDAGLKGKLTDNGDTATFEIDLAVGNKVSIAGKEYTIADETNEDKNELKVEDAADKIETALKSANDIGATKTTSVVTYSANQKVRTKDSEDAKFTAKSAMVAWDGKNFTSIAAGTDITKLVQDTNTKLYKSVTSVTLGATDKAKSDLLLVHDDTIAKGIDSTYAEGATVATVANKVTVANGVATAATGYTFYEAIDLVADTDTNIAHAASAKLDAGTNTDSSFDLKFEELPADDVEKAKLLAEGQNALKAELGNITYTHDGTNGVYSHKFTNTDLDVDKTGAVSYKGEKIATIEVGTAAGKANQKAGTDTLALKAGTTFTDADAATTDGSSKYTFKITKGTTAGAKDLSFNLHVGADADMTNKINVTIEAMSTENLGIKGLNVADKDGVAATYAIDAIQDAISKVSSQRSALGAVQNRLEHTIANLDNVVENTTAAESRIRDTDMAEEMVNYSKNNILAQAGQSMLAQANQSNQGVLSLLQ